MNILRVIARELLPPVLSRPLATLARRWGSGGQEWEYRPEGERAWEKYPGWDHPSVSQAQREKWPAFRAALAEPLPLGVSHESRIVSSGHYAVHNTLMTFGYVLGRAAQGRGRLSLLDWGGGSGHYGALAHALLPEVSLEYACRDFAALCALGREMLPDAVFFDSDEPALARRYDLVYASSSAHYSRNFHGLLGRLCSATGSWLMITRIPVIEEHDDFAVLQRPWVHGYRTEYVGWFVNRRRMIATVEGQGLSLVREFLVDERPFVPGAPEQCRYGGFLFRRNR